MRIRIALTAFFCLLACCALVAQSKSSRADLLKPSTTSNSGRTSATQSGGGRGIFDVATSSDAGRKAGSVAPAAGRSTATVSPFGTASNRARSSYWRRY